MYILLYYIYLVYKYMVNIISKENIEKIMDKIKNITNFNILCINWGKKNGNFPDIKQINIAKNLADYGIDLNRKLSL